MIKHSLSPEWRNNVKLNFSSEVKSGLLGDVTCGIHLKFSKQYLILYVNRNYHWRNAVVYILNMWDQHTIDKKIHKIYQKYVT